VSAKAGWPHDDRPDARRLTSADPVVIDTMIITGLVAANKTDMLLASMAARARIVPAVAKELRWHARRIPELQPLIPQPGAGSSRTLGQQIDLTREEALQAFAYQRAWNSLAVIDARPGKDRGEAEALAVADARGWSMLSHDHDAVGPKGWRSPHVLGIPELLMLFAAEGRCLGTSAWRIYCALIAETPELTCQGWSDDIECERIFSECCGLMVAAIG
jgi:hypothetical protein